MTQKYTTEEFIERARCVHGDKYDYSKVEYVNSTTNVVIGCKTHGWFQQRPSLHLYGHGCPYCAGTKKRTLGEFIDLAHKIHDNQYDYSKVVYVNNKTKVCITCPEHGDFYQTPESHLFGQGCPICYDERRGKTLKSTTKEFIDKAKNIHGDKYDYSFVDYKNAIKKVKIVCPVHGAFFQTPNAHLSGQGCYLCGIERMRDTYKTSLNDFISKANKIHNNKYDYSKVVYINNKEKICIICPKHGDFLQIAENHLLGSGCPMCNDSKGERSIVGFLQKFNIKYVRQFKIPNISIFCENSVLKADFFLPDTNTIIEYNGEQHYNEHFFTRFNEPHKYFEQQQKRDEAMRLYCNEHKMKLIEIPYWEYNNIEAILRKELHIKNKI